MICMYTRVILCFGNKTERLGGGGGEVGKTARF